MDADAFGNPLVGSDELEPRDARLADLALGHRPHHEDARVAKCGSEVERFRQRRDAERGCAGVERGLRDVDRAVAVPLRLHDGPELGSFRRTQERRGVPPNRPEVEGEARPLHGGHSLLNRCGLATRVERVGSGTADADVRAAVAAERVVSAAAEDAVVAVLPRIVSTAALPRTRFDAPSR